MSKRRNKKHGSGRSSQEYAKLAKIIKSLPNDPTMPQTFIDRTLNQKVYEEDDEEVNSPRQKSKSRRFHLHIKENWPSYLIGGVLSIFGFLFVTMYPKVIRTEITSENNTTKINDIVSDLKDSKSKFEEEQKIQDEKISANSGDIKSIKDSFSLYVQLNKNPDYIPQKDKTIVTKEDD